MAIVGHGRPMVTNRGGYTEPVWESSQVVALTDLADGPEEIARRALELLSGADLDAMGRAADRLYRDRFALGHTVDAFETGFQELASP